MTVYTLDHRNCEFILSEANGQRSRDSLIVKSGAGKLKAGTLVQYDAVATTKVIAATGTFTTSTSTLVTNLCGIIMYDVDATSADVKVAAITRSAEVKDPLLTYPSNVDTTPTGVKAKAANAKSLALLDIVVRTEFTT